MIFIAAGLFFFAASIIIPNAAALCMQPFKYTAGLAASIVGCLQIGGGVVTSSIISYAPDYDQLPLAIIFISISLIGITISYKIK